MKNNFQSAANHNKIIPPFNVFFGQVWQTRLFYGRITLQKVGETEWITFKIRVKRNELE